MAYKTGTAYVMFMAFLSGGWATNHVFTVQAVNASAATCPRSSSQGATQGNSSETIRTTAHATLSIVGLVSPAVVSGAVLVSVVGASPSSPVTYCLDGRPQWVSSYDSTSSDEGGHSGVRMGFSLSGVVTGKHFLQAFAVRSDGRVLASDVVTLLVEPTIDHEFSEALPAYALQPSVRQPLDMIVRRTSTPGAELTAEEVETRRKVAAMYLNFGIDVSLDNEIDQSMVLTNLLPRSWAKPKTTDLTLLSMQFSSDASFYHPIPKGWPHVRLPRGYLRSIQLNTNQGGDGIGYGIAVAHLDAPIKTVSSMWYTQEETRKVFDFRVPDDWQQSLPERVAADRHMIFVDSANGTFISLYKTTVNPATGTPHALYASSPTSFDSLGDHGGSTASGFSELPLLIEPGEATSDGGAIRHAIGGPVSRTWAARVYPATARDYGVMTSTNSCTGKGMTNTGLVPYGGIIQLDPALDLTRMKLSRPALRILQAMQTYGYYVMDFGCSDLDIYTAIPERELAPFGGLYASSAGQPGVQAEIAMVLSSSDLYVVPPPTRRPGGQ